MFSAGTAHQHQEGKNTNLSAKADHSAAGGRQKQRANGQEPEDTDDEPAFLPNLAENQRNERDWDDQLGKSREVVAVDVRTKRNSAIAHLTEPVQFAVEGKLLQDAQNRHKKTEYHDEPDESAPLVRGAEDLRDKEEND